MVTTRLLFVQLAGEGAIFNFGAWKLVWVPWERVSRGQTQDSSDFVAKFTLGCRTERKSEDCWSYFKKKKMGLKLCMN